MRSQLTEMIMTVLKESMQTLIFKKYKELAEAYNKEIK